MAPHVAILPPEMKFDYIDREQKCSVIILYVGGESYTFRDNGIGYAVSMHVAQELLFMTCTDKQNMKQF